MTEMGHNGGPAIDPLEAVAADYSDLIDEATNWADGEAVTDDAAEAAVDKLIKEWRTYKADLVKAGKEVTEPLHKAWKAGVAQVKVYTDDADLMQKSLVALVADHKAERAKRVEAEKRAAWEAANKARQEAEEAERQAKAGDIEAARAAEYAKQSALDAEKAAQAQSKAKVGGMRSVKHHEVVSMRDLVNWIAKNDKDAMAAFATEYARKHSENIPDAIVRSWTEKEAY